VERIRTFVLGAIAAVCLCRCVFSAEPTLAPPRPPATASSADEQADAAPILITARSIRVAAPLEKIDALLGSLAGKTATDTNVLIRCDRIEIVRPGSDSMPEIECFGDVIVRGRDCFVQAERVVKRGNSLTFEGTNGKPVQIVRQHKGKPDVHLTTNEMSLDLAAGRVALSGFRAVKTKAKPQSP
jgi:hypothetical protein